MPCGGAALRPLSPVLHEALALPGAAVYREQKYRLGAWFSARRRALRVRGCMQPHASGLISIGALLIFRGKSATKKTKKNALSL